MWESVVSSSFVAIQTKQGMHMSPRDLNLRRQWTKFVQVKRADFVEPSNIFIYPLIPMWESVVSSSFVAIQTKQGMHMSPRDLNLRRQWTKFVQVKRADFVEPSKHSVICGAHFTSDCFESGYMREMAF